MSRTVERLRRSALCGYGLAFVSVGAALLLTIIFLHFDSPLPFTGFALTAIVITFWYSSTRPGIFAVFLSTLVRSYFFQPVNTVVSRVLYDSVFLGFALLMIWITRERNELEVKVAERTAELTETNEKLKLEIVERKQAEEAVKQAEDRLRLILDTTPALIHTGRPDGYLDYFSQRWLEYVGLPLEDLQGWAWIAAIHAEDVEEMVNGWRATLASGEPLVHEARVRRADGEYRWMLHHDVPLRDAHGNIVKWYASSIDIEDHKRAEEVLRQSEERFRKLVELLPVAVYVTDRSGMIQSYNNQASVLWGREPKLGDPAQRYCGSLRIYSLDGRFLPHQESKMAEVLRTGVEVRNQELMIERPDGSRITVAVNIVPLRNDAGELVGAINCFQDITQRKQAEMERRTLIDAIPQQIYSGPADGTIDYCNERWRSYVGLSLEELQGDGWQSMLHPDDRDRVINAWRGSVANGTPYEQEERHRGADGRYRWFLSRAVPLRDDDGQILRWYGTNTDIEDRKLAEQELRQAEERIRAILEYSPNWIFLKDTEGRYLLVNREVERVFGMSQEQIIGKTDSEIFPPEHAAEYRANDLKVLRAGLTMEFEEIALLEDGPHTSIVHKFPLFDTRGNIYATGAVATDITERKRAEEALRRSEERYRLIVENQTEFIIKWLPDGTRTFVNENYCRTFGIAEADCLGTSFYPLIDPEFREGIKRKVAALRPGKPEFTEVHPSFLPDGQHWQQWMTRGIFDAGGNLIELVSAGRDITQLKRAEEELRQLSGSLLRSQDEERRRIARDLHDSTGQDLVALATMLGQLRGSIPSGERKSHTLLSECMALADQCIREVRTLSYMLHPPLLDEAGLEDAIRDYAKGFTKRSGIQVELELSPRVGRVARDVELALFRVVQEGLTNIQRHSGSQQAKIRIHRNSDLTLEISDRGRGAFVSRRRGKEDPRFEIGVGILSMQERVKLVGGRLDIDSTSHGTTVRVTVPLGGSEHEEASNSDR
jgi:PAS domain S-box-containing protein